MGPGTWVILIMVVSFFGLWFLNDKFSKTKPCHACNAKVSKQARVCPSCGQPDP